MDLTDRCGKVLKATYAYSILIFGSCSTLDRLSNEKM